MDKAMLRQAAQQLQAKLAKAEEELSNAIIETSSGGDVVKVEMDGQQKLRSLKISPEVFAEGDVELLQDLIIAAVNEASTISQEFAKKHLSSVSTGLNIPGLT
jgi:hypothetical protein